MAKTVSATSMPLISKSGSLSSIPLASQPAALAKRKPSLSSSRPTHPRKASTARAHQVNKKSTSTTSPRGRQRTKEYLCYAERVWALANDPYLQGLSSRCVQCRGCQEYQMLDRRNSFYSGFWVKHKSRCQKLHQKYGLKKNDPRLKGLPKPPEDVAIVLRAGRAEEEEKAFIETLLKDKLLPEKYRQARLPKRAVAPKKTPKTPVLPSSPSTSSTSDSGDSIFDSAHCSPSSSSNTSPSSSPGHRVIQPTFQSHQNLYKMDDGYEFPLPDPNYRFGQPDLSFLEPVSPTPPTSEPSSRPEGYTQVLPYIGDQNKPLDLLADVCWTA